MRERIIQFIESEQLSAAEFADRIGVQRSSVSHVLNGRNNPGFSFIQKILEHFQHLDARWLLTGEGSMIKQKIQQNSKQELSDNLFNFQKTTDEQTVKKQAINSNPQPSKHEMVTMKAGEQQPVNLIETEKKISRVLIFYDDHTFEDFRPAK